MRRPRLPAIVLLAFPLITSAVPAVAQVSRSSQGIASGAVQTIVPAKIGTASLIGLVPLSLSPGAKAFVKAAPQTTLVNLVAPGNLYRYEARDGKTLLVETKYEKVTTPYGIPSLKAVAERLYPGETRLVYTGPWITGGISMGFTGATFTGFATYILRPVGVLVPTATPRGGIPAAEAVMAGTVVIPKSGTPVRTMTLDVAMPRPTEQDCGVKINDESLSDRAQLRGFVCLLLTQDGQGMTLPDGS